MKNFPILLSLLLLLLSSCAFLLPSPRHLDAYQLRASFQQGPCFGRCPVYTLSLYQNGLLLYEGERFTDMPGTWYKLLGRAEVAALIDSFTVADMSRFPLSFPSNVPDASVNTLTFVDVKQQKTYRTSFREEAPKELKYLAERMAGMAAVGGFRQYVDTIRTGETFFGQPIELKKEELLVHLYPEVNPQAWIIKYSKQNASIKERLTPNGHYYLLLADPNSMPTDELLELLRQDRDVISAQRNQQVTPR